MRAYHFLKAEVIMYEEEALPHIFFTDPAVLLHDEVPLGPVVNVGQDVRTE